jgi:hypothetical protein
MAGIVTRDAVAVLGTRRSPDSKWMGCLEWTVGATGDVQCVAARTDHMAALRRLGRRPQLPSAWLDEVHGEGDMMMYVRLEPSMYVADASVRNVWDVNNFGLDPTHCGKGFFRGFLEELLSWADDPRQNLGCAGVVVSNVCNRRLKRHLLEGTATEYGGRAVVSNECDVWFPARTAA